MTVLLLVTLIISVGAILAPGMTGGSISSRYRSYSELDKFLHQIASSYPGFASVYSIGRSVLGKELLAVKITAPSSSPIGTPHVKLIGNIHGNEVVGKELLLYFSQYLLTTYDTELEVQNLLNNTVIHILPSLNPDGLEFSREGDCNIGPGRENAKGIDLNRSFPDKNRNNTIPRQPETVAVMQWLRAYQFVLSASLHGGALVVNYPLDSLPGSRPGVLEFLDELEANGTTGELLLELVKDYLIENAQDGIYAPSADDDVFVHLAKTYANNHATMHLGPPCNGTPSFPGGITNGAAWYALTGGMQDYNYFEHGCMELTMEISCCKYPGAGLLPYFWNDNKKALIEFVKESHQGVRGQILDATTGDPIKNVTLYIDKRPVPFSTSNQGEFWRILLPGTYTLLVQAPGYIAQSVPFSVNRIPLISGTSATWLSVYLQSVRDVAAETETQETANSESTTLWRAALKSTHILLITLSLIKI